MMLRVAALLLTLLSVQHHQVLADEELTTPTSTQPSAATTLGTLFRQARSEHYYSRSPSGSRYGDESLPLTAGASARVDPIEVRDSTYYESRCITCDPNKALVAAADRDPYQGRWRQRGKYDYYDDEYEERRYRDRYDGYYDRARAPAYDYDRYDPYGRNELFKPSTYDRYDPYERDRYYGRPVDRPADRPLVDRPLADRPLDRPVDRPVDRPLIERPYDRSYERGNGYDNLEQRFPYDDRYDRYGPQRRPPYDDYGPPRSDRYNANRNYGRYDPRYDRYDPYDRNGYRRHPAYDDRYERYGGGGIPASDSRGYYAGAGGGGWPAPGAPDRPAYASAWNYAGGSRESWRDGNRERDRERDRDRDRDAAFYRPRDYFYDSTAAPGGSRGTSYLYDRPESSTKPDADRDKPTNSPQTQDANKTYKD